MINDDTGCTKLHQQANLCRERFIIINCTHDQYNKTHTENPVQDKGVINMPLEKYNGQNKGEKY